LRGNWLAPNRASFGFVLPNAQLLVQISRMFAEWLRSFA
jgi:hypothetical protein